MNELLARIKAAGSVKVAEVLSESSFFNAKDQITTNLPMLNIAFSASPSGGFSSGLSLFAGESKTFKCCGKDVILEVYKPKSEKITTTYSELYKSFQKNNNQELYVKDYNGEYTPILAMIKKEPKMLYVAFSTGYMIEVAEEHAFMTKDRSPIFAKDLVHNSRIMTTYGLLKVVSIKKSNSNEAYDISINSPHWYINDEENGIIHHNTMLGLLAMQAYMETYPDSIVLFYDSEYGTTPEYLKTFNIDTKRIIHIPVLHIEELKFDIVKRLDEIKKKDKVFIFIDSLGNLASKKEVEDAENAKSVADLTRAKAIKSLFRIITPTLTVKEIPCFCVMHVYKTMDMFPRTIVSGGCLDKGTKIQTPEGLVEIQNIKKGDKVNTLSGPQKVLNTWDRDTLEEGNPECYKITFEDGHSVITSDKHKFLIGENWIEAKDLTENLVCSVLNT